MESIVINQKRLQVDVFYAFSANRFVNTRWVQPCVSGDFFFWELATSEEYPEKVVYKFSRDHVAIRSSSVSDIISEIERNWRLFQIETGSSDIAKTA